jgi:hypothetical protein
VLFEHVFYGEMKDKFDVKHRMIKGGIHAEFLEGNLLNDVLSKSETESGKQY